MFKESYSVTRYWIKNVRGTYLKRTEEIVVNLDSETLYFEYMFKRFRWHRMIHMGMHVRVSEVP